VRSAADRDYASGAVGRRTPDSISAEPRTSSDVRTPTPHSASYLRVSARTCSESRGSKSFILVCLCVCLSVCPQHNSKPNDPKVFKLGILQGMTLGYPKSDMVLRQKVKGQGHMVTKCKNILKAIEWPV